MLSLSRYNDVLCWYRSVADAIDSCRRKMKVFFVQRCVVINGAAFECCYIDTISLAFTDFLFQVINTVSSRISNKKASIRWQDSWTARRQLQAVFPVITGSFLTNVIAHLHGLSMDLTAGRTVGPTVDSTVGW